MKLVSREEAIQMLKIAGCSEQIVLNAEHSARTFDAIAKLSFAPNDRKLAKHTGIAVVPREGDLLYYCIVNVTEAQLQEWANTIDAEQGEGAVTNDFV